MTCRRGARSLIAAAIAVTAASETTARGQTPSSNDNVAAEALFEDARTLVAAGKYAEACPKFADSERLGPSASTLLNLANCWEKAGHTATAWATYRQAASAANAAGRKDYVVTATRHADSLGTKLARLVITVVQPAPGMQIKRDGAVVDTAEWGAGIPVDVGSHSVEAMAPGRKSWVAAIQVSQDGAQASVMVPALEEVPSEAPSVAPVAPVVATAPAPAPVVPPSEPEASPIGRGQRVAGAVMAGAGVVGLGVGTVLALSAKSKYNDSLANCETSNANLCTAQGLTQRDSARSTGDAATVALGIGAAVFVAGGVLWLSAPHGSGHAGGGATFQVAPTLGGFIARGAW